MSFRRGSGVIWEKMNASRDLAEIYGAAIAAVDPYHAVLDAVKIAGDLLVVPGASCDLSKFDRILVVGAGKAAGRMAMAAEKLLAQRKVSGLVIVKEGHGSDLDVIGQVEASHPVPDERGEEGARRILEMVRDADDRTLILCLLSGGASALLVLPDEGLTLGDKQRATSLLLKSGASIDEMNAVRKHLSKVKGGRLAQAAFPAKIVTLVISDVIGDRLDVIASGPTVADESTFADALAVIEKYGLREEMPERVVDQLEKGAAGVLEETLKISPGNCGIVVANIGKALEAAGKKSRMLGYDTKLIGSILQGEARDAARFLSGVARERLAGLMPGKRHCLLCGGETTVTVMGEGKGGRNQELALAFAIAIEGMPGIAMLSAGTDGGDGPTDAAGAIVDGQTCIAARQFGLQPESYLENNDSYRFFSSLDALSGSTGHFKTGPTGTNVMDIQVMLLRKD